MKRYGWIVVIALVLMIPFTLAVMQGEAVISLDIIGVDANKLPIVDVNTSVLDAQRTIDLRVRYQQLWCWW